MVECTIHANGVCLTIKENEHICSHICTCITHMLQVSDQCSTFVTVCFNQFVCKTTLFKQNENQTTTDEHSQATPETVIIHCCKCIHGIMKCSEIPLNQIEKCVCVCVTNHLCQL
jgi:hypothetical protein